MDLLTVVSGKQDGVRAFHVENLLVFEERDIRPSIDGDGGGAM